MAESQGREHKQLHFYPGPKRLAYFVDGAVVLDVEAWGGPEFPQAKRRGEKFGPGPTTPGRFRVGWVGRYHTPTWANSRIPWGTRLKLHPSDPDDVLYEASPGQWRSVKRKTGASRDDVKELNRSLYHRSAVPDRWVFNDFGPIAVRYYRDGNNNRKQDADEPLSGEMFHTTPDNEADPGNRLYESHGCIHLRPVDRDSLLKNKAFELGTLVVIHAYGEAAAVPRPAQAAP